MEFHLGSISGNPGPRAEDRGSGARAPTARCHPPQAAPVWPNKGPVVVWALSLGRLNGHKLHWTIGGSQGLVLVREGQLGFHEPTLAIDSPEERSAKLYVEAITSHFWLLLKGHEETAIIVRKGARDGRKLQIPNHSGVLQLQPVPDMM